MTSHTSYISLRPKITDPLIDFLVPRATLRFQQKSAKRMSTLLHEQYVGDLFKNY